MFFVVGDAVARAHRPAMLPPALANTDAPRRRKREAVAIVGKRELGGELRWPITDAEPQILIDPIRIDDFARVHPPVGIPDCLEFTEGLDQLGAEHLRQELGFRLAVSVLTGKRSAHRHDEIACFVHERLVGLDAAMGLEIEVDACVHASLPEVAVQRTVVLMLFEQLAQIAKILSELLRRRRRIFPALPCDRLSRHTGGRAECGFADSPNCFFLLLVITQPHRLCGSDTSPDRVSFCRFLQRGFAEMSASLGHVARFAESLKIARVW